jgi:hypothetical protein
MSLPERRRGDQEWLPIEMLQDWFEEHEEARGVNTEPRPSGAQWSALIRSLQVRVNRQQNLELERQAELEKRDVPLHDLKDVDPKEWFDQKLKPVIDAADNVLAYLEDLEMAAETFEKRGGILSNGVALTEILGLKIYAMPILHALGADPERPAKERPGPGRPRDETWRPVARPFDCELRVMLHQIGYCGPTGRHVDSLTTFVGMRAINHVYGLSIRPGGYVAGLSDRNRTGKQPKPKKRAKSVRKER